MIVLIGGASHTGKTRLAQRLLERYGFPYLSIDHLKMGLIRSGQTDLTPMSSDQELTAYLWPIVREIVRTALENGQNLIVEGCYVPFDWQKDFGEHLAEMRGIFLAMSEPYIRSHLGDIRRWAGVIEKRLPGDEGSLETLLADNARVIAGCAASGADCIIIDGDYRVDFAL